MSWIDPNCQNSTLNLMRCPLLFLFSTAAIFTFILVGHLQFRCLVLVVFRITSSIFFYKGRKWIFNYVFISTHVHNNINLSDLYFSLFPTNPFYFEQNILLRKSTFEILAQLSHKWLFLQAHTDGRKCFWFQVGIYRE